MNFNRKSAKQPELPLDPKGRPTLIEVHGWDEFTALCDRTRLPEDDPQAMRLVYYEMAIGFTSAGYPATNADWVFKVYYPQKHAQEILDSMKKQETTAKKGN